jgi:poly(beta-D-mannuronate) C5 epimerase
MNVQNHFILKLDIFTFGILSGVSLLLLLLLFSIQIIFAAPTVATSCIIFDPSTRLITITCATANLADVYKQLNNNTILAKQQSSSSGNVWLLNANLTIAKGATFYINSTDTSWLKLGSDGTNAYGIQVYGSLKINSTKITSWNLKTNGYVTTITNEAGTVPRPFIIINEKAAADANADISNSEIAYLKHLSYYGGNRSILRNNNIHHNWFGFYSNGVGGIIIENNRVHDNGRYGIDPHTRTHDMLIRNNVVHDNGEQGIICSSNCYNITIENNEVYHNAKSGIMLDGNMSNSVARNNTIYNETQGIFVSNSHNNEIYDNRISSSQNGIYLQDKSSKNIIHDNKVLKPSFAGLIVDTNSSDNMFYSNSIENSRQYGIIENSNATNNIFKNNQIFFSNIATCSKGWYITGYFTPVENDYSGPTKMVVIEGNLSKTFSSSFLDAVKIQGWGKTKQGNYIGYYSSSYHLSSQPLNSNNNPLQIGNIATEPLVIATNSHVTIPTLPSPWNSMAFTSADVAKDIRGKQIDVYVGEGKLAKQETLRVTGTNNKVCY